MRSVQSLLIFLSGIGIALTGTAIGQFAAEPAPSATSATATMQAFPDVQTDTFFAPSVATMVRSGVVKGYSDGNFGPDDPVTRGQVTVMIDRYDKKVVQPLREQLMELRKLNNLGRCGDGAVQTGEQCDDANTTDGDGCSSACLTEEKPERPEICGNGTCDSGEATVCTSSCPMGGQGCVTSCTPGTCPRDCTPKPACGNGKCEQGESALCPTCTSGSLCKPCTPCTEDCSSTCGNGTCDPGESTVCTTKCPTGDQKGCANLCTVGTCPKDCGRTSDDELDEEERKIPILGGDRDEHGCIGSAGYSWCAVKQKCLRIWEEACE